jgi:hypothetical protein
MDNIKELLEKWKEDGLVNPTSLEAAYGAIVLLVAKVEELENKIKDLSI